MRTAGVLIAVALALALQTTLARFVVGGTTAIDLVLVAVVYIALTSGPVSGMLAGSLAGLIQDQLSTGVLGNFGKAGSRVKHYTQPEIVLSDPGTRLKSGDS